jgi:hypothetical protein
MTKIKMSISLTPKMFKKKKIPARTSILLKMRLFSDDLSSVSSDVIEMALFLDSTMPRIVEMMVTTDNAGCFAGTDFTVCLPRIFQLGILSKSPLRIILLDHNENREGKEFLDASFSFVGNLVISMPGTIC